MLSSENKSFFSSNGWESLSKISGQHPTPPCLHLVPGAPTGEDTCLHPHSHCTVLLPTPASSTPTTEWFPTLREMWGPETKTEHHLGKDGSSGQGLGET